jgi:acetyl-CoA C-acetyltransferase
MGLRGEAAIIGIAELPAQRKQTRPELFTIDQYAQLARMVVEDAGIDAEQ